MAYADVSNVVNDLSEHLMDEENFLLGVEEQVLHLHTELLKMKNFPKNSEGKCDQVHKIRDIACKVADIVDTYIVNVTKKRRRNNPVKFFCSFNKATMVHSVKQQIKQLKTITKVINDNRESYHNQQNDANEDEESHKTDLMQRSKMEVEEDDVIGLVEEPKTLVNQLVRDNPEVQQNGINKDEEVGLVEETKALVNQQVKDKFKIQHDNINKDEQLQTLDLLQKPKTELEKADDTSLIDETKILANHLVKDKSKIQQNNSIKDEKLKMHDLQQNQMMGVDENNVVGFIEEAETLVNQLVYGKKELDVISIFGEGGLGKTTLARKVYNNEKVKDHFRLRAWVSVSQTLKLRELLLEILKAVSPMTDKISKMKKKQLKHELKTQLSDHKYLVVLDDMWRTQHWDELKVVFPNDINGSRVFVTTRSKDVACYASNEKKRLDLQPLNGKQSRELFTKKVFGQAGSCPKELKRLRKDFVAKSGGLPLAIVVLGGLLASKDKTPTIWNTTRILWDTAESVDWYEQQDTQCLEALEIFSLSYRDLPPYLQPCFLYLGLFPEDYNISARQLIRLWISEGFVEEKDDIKTRKEDVAESYLNQLIDRSLIQVEERRSDGGVKTCRMHDLIRDFCLHMSMKEKFLESHNSVNSAKTKPQRLSIHCSRRDYILGAKSSNTCSVRTLLCFNDDNRDLSQKHWKSLFKSFELIRVLDLGEEEVNKLPTSIHKLILLKYLRVKIADNARLPSSICDLNHLQTLDLRTSIIDELPEGIWSMQQLRHLYLNGPGRLPKNTGTKFLFNLQSLCYLSTDSTEGMHIAENAPNLRKLGLYGYRCNSSDEQDYTFKLPNLESLKFVHQCIFHVRINLPATISSISIKKANLQPETMETFQNLPNLQILKLDGASFHREELSFNVGWFPALQLLKIENSSIKIWKLEEGASPNLKQVVISKCPDLKSLPEKLWAMTTLQELQLMWLPDIFTKTIGKFKKRSEVKIVIYPPAP